VLSFEIFWDLGRWLFIEGAVIKSLRGITIPLEVLSYVHLKKFVKKKGLAFKGK